MNLTSKRMLQFMTVCAGACALSASAVVTQFAADSFEAPEGADGLGITYYKGATNEFGNLTNQVWYSGAGDASKLVPSNSPYAGIRPITNITTDLVLNLETEGQTLTRELGVTNNFVTGSPVYVDTLIKFTPSEDDPVINDAMVKAAVFVNAQSNLVVYHKDYDAVPQVSTNTVLNYPINPAAWYRLTIVLGQIDSTALFQVYVNGSPITSMSAYDESANHPGTWFKTAGSDQTISAVAFQGTGMVDELVVADGADLTAPTAALLTLMFDSGILSVTTNGVGVANLDKVATGTTIVIDAKPWYEITSGGALLTITASNLVSGTSMLSSLTGSVNGDDGLTNSITSALYSSNASLPTGFGPYAIADISAWALAQSPVLDPEDVTAGMLDNFLLNLADEDANATIKINSIVYDSNAGEVVVTVGSSNTAVDFDTIYGTIKVQTRASLSTGSWSEPALYNVQIVSPGTTAEITIPIGTDRFYQAFVE